jgi:hypothetical protein
MSRRQPPPWVAERNPTTDRARSGSCPRCHQPILRALVGRVAALDIRADPVPLDLAAELAARLAGRHTYCLTNQPYLPARLLERGRLHIESGRCSHLVVADHRCPERPTGPVQEELPL